MRRSGKQDDSLDDLLRAADPASRLTPLGPHQVHNLLETVMRSPETPAPTRRTSRRLVPALLGGVLAAGLAVAAVVVTQPGTRSTEPALALTVSASDAMADCMPAADTLQIYAGGDAPAFAGVVTSVDGDRAVLRVTRVYQGEVPTSVEVTSTDASTYSTVGEFPLYEGAEYLVAATTYGGVAVCGASGPASPELTELYEQAFR